MTLKQVEVFLAVADSRSFSKGGDAVSLAQSTASQHIRALEDELGARLFNRSSGHVSLTEAGRLFYEHARRICRASDRAKRALRRFQGLDEAILRIAASTTPASCLIPDLLGSFSRNHPGVRLELNQGDSQDVIRCLLAEEAELAVTGGKFDEEQIVYEVLGVERILLVACPGNIHHDLPEKVLLKKLPMIVRESGSGTRQAVDSVLTKSGIAPNELQVVAQLGSSEAVRRAVLSGAGCAFMSALAVARELGEKSLVKIELPDITIERSFYLAVHRGRNLSPAALAFVSLLKQFFALSGNRHT